MNRAALSSAPVAATAAAALPGRSAYVTDQVYPSHFFRETMPLWLVSVLTALGRRAPDLTQPYSWLELGCGSGLGTLVAAATNPLGRFIGVDFNPAAVAQAEAQAEAARLHNVQFLCADFADLLRTHSAAVPDCDFIVAHGVYSWIEPAARQAIQTLVQQRLQPGGVLYLGYLSQPGSAGFAAAQRMLRLHALRQPGHSGQQLRLGVALLQQMARAGLGYFEDHPRVLADVPAADSLDATSAAYFAHDYLNRHWDALHVSDVIEDLAGAGCEFAGSAAPYENVEAASLPTGAQQLLEALREQGAPVAEIETFKDLARNQRSRADLYQRSRPGGNVLDNEAHRQALLAQRVCLLPAAPGRPVAQQGVLTFETRIGPVQLPMALVGPLLEALQDGPRRYAELARLPAHARQPGRISSLLQVLAWAGWVQFVRPDLPAVPPAQDAAWAATQRLNQVLAQQPEPFNGAFQALAALGSAFALPPDGLSDAQLRRMQPMEAGPMG